MVPGIGPAASKFSQKVYEDTTLELETFEAARLRMAQINGCLFCKDWRTERDGVTVGDDFPGFVEDWAGQGGNHLSTRARIAAEYAERFALDHHGIDDAAWARFRAEFTDNELVELTMCLGSWLAFEHLFPLMFPGGASRAVPAWGWLAYGLLVGAAGVIGDLAESLLKRDVGQKNSSDWMPGFGGVLDILDSVLLAAPVAYLCWALELV